MAYIKKHWTLFVAVSCMLIAISAGVFSFNTDVRDVKYAYTPASVRNNIMRPLNTSYKPSEQRDCIVTYSGNITCTSGLLNASGGRVILEESANGSVWTSIDTQYANIGSGLVDTKTFPIKLSGSTKRNMFLRMRTDNVNGTPTYVIRPGMEILNN